MWAALRSVRPAALALRVNSPAARAPSILRVLAMQALPAPELPARAQALALAQSLGRPVPASAHAPVPAELRRPPAKLRARSVPPRAAAAEDSSSTLRPKKAR